MNLAVPLLALVVEDDPLQREVLSDALKRENLDVIQCESAEAAELVVARFGVELRVMVTDVELAGPGNGIELAAFARRCCPDLPIIVVSGADPAALPSGIRFFAKPYRISELLEAVHG
ncbi:MAG TPA: response regulator [Bradyrhizobium sp.]|nr:response regulator [Bradyrhizobium sp.]